MVKTKAKVTTFSATPRDLEMLEVVARLFAENLGRFLDGKPLKELVDRAAGY